MYGGSYVANLFKQKVASHRNVLFATVTLHNFFMGSLIIVTAKIVHALTGLRSRR